MRYHLGVFATKPWLNGRVYWALRSSACARAGTAATRARAAAAPEGPRHASTDEQKPAYFDAAGALQATVHVPLAALEQRR